MGANVDKGLHYADCDSEMLERQSIYHRLDQFSEQLQRLQSGINRAIGLGEAMFNVRVYASHLPGNRNVAADAASRAWTKPFDNVWTDFASSWRQSHSLADSSSIKYATTWRQWTRWCTALRLPVWLPAQPDQHSHQLALFAVYCWKYGWGLDGQSNAASTVVAKVSHISWHHQRMHGYSVGLLPGHRLAITGMRRVSASPTRKAPVTIPMLRSMFESLNFKSAQDRVTWGATVVGFYFLLRRSEYLAQGTKHSVFALTRSDVHFVDQDGNECSRVDDVARVVINFRGSKNDQFGEGTERSLGRSGSVWLCPVYAAWCLTSHHDHLRLPRSALLCTVSPGRMAQVREVTALIKNAAEHHGLDPARCGTHSLRSGGATALFAAGIDSLAVKKFGRWKSSAYERYTRLDEQRTRDMAKVMLDPMHSAALIRGQPPSCSPARRSREYIRS